MVAQRRWEALLFQIMASPESAVLSLPHNTSQSNCTFETQGGKRSVYQLIPYSGDGIQNTLAAAGMGDY